MTWPWPAAACRRGPGAPGNDPGRGRFRATKLVLPEAVVKRLGLPLGDPIKVRYADGRRATRRGIKGVFVQLLGRDGTFTAIGEPKRETALSARSSSKTSICWSTA